MLLDSHQCYYSVKENNIESGLQYTEVCQNSEQLCVVVTSETEDYEYRLYKRDSTICRKTIPFLRVSTLAESLFNSS